MSKPVKLAELSGVLERWSRSPAQLPKMAQPSAPLPTGAEDVLDLVVLRSFRDLQQEGKPDFVSELIELYLKDTTVRLAEMHAGLKGNNAPAVKRVAHALKGSSGNLGVRRMAALCMELEETVGDGALDRVGVILIRLEAEFERVREALAGEMQTASR